MSKDTRRKSREKEYKNKKARKQCSTTIRTKETKIQALDHLFMHTRLKKAVMGW